MFGFQIHSIPFDGSKRVLLVHGISRIFVDSPRGVQCGFFLRKNPRGGGGFALYQSEKCYSRNAEEPSQDEESVEHAEGN
jgi:hypothetical protein